MRLAFTSDIHYDISPWNRAFARHLLDAVEALSPDVFLIAGDISADLVGLEEALSLFAALPCHKMMVPGNHDLWVTKNAVRRRRRDSWYKYTSAIPEICRKHGFSCLATDPLVIDGVGFVGSVGWYDFSMRDPELDAIYSAWDYERGEFSDRRFPTGTWNDMRFVQWLRDPGASDWRQRRATLSTPRAFERVFDLFREKVTEILDRSTQLVLVIHTAPFRSCVSNGDGPDPFNAYGGSDRLGDLLVSLAEARPVTCLTGHQHAPLDITVSGVRVLRSPVGYLRGSSRDDARKAEEILGVLLL